MNSDFLYVRLYLYNFGRCDLLLFLITVYLALLAQIKQQQIHFRT